MADMRLIVAGAGGRMGRTLVKAIAETKGLTLAGGLEGEAPVVAGHRLLLATQVRHAVALHVPALRVRPRP